MAIKMVREPSATPNINNIDDIVPMRYAYGNQDGYVISKGTEVAATVNGSSFTIGSGRIVVQGVECDIDANGITIVVDNIATKKYFSVYLKVNLGTNTVNIQSEDDTAAYPDIQRGDDLTHTSTGIANLLLYTFEAQNGIISNVQKKIQAIEYSGTALADYDISKGTVEERLTRLGFKQGELVIDTSILDNKTSIAINTLKRQGNYVIGDFTISTSSTGVIDNIYQLSSTTEQQVKCINIPKEFRPAKDTAISVYTTYRTMQGLNFNDVSYFQSIKVTEDGYLPIPNEPNEYGVSYYVRTIRIHFGYEANPL